MIMYRHQWIYMDAPCIHTAQKERFIENPSYMIACHSCLGFRFHMRIPQIPQVAWVRCPKPPGSGQESEKHPSNKQHEEALKNSKHDELDAHLGDAAMSRHRYGSQRILAMLRQPGNCWMQDVRLFQILSWFQVQRGR